MFTKYKKWFSICSILLLHLSIATAQSILPPVIEWSGKSENIIAQLNNRWITPAEKSGFENTPNYNETVNWLRKLSDASPLLTMVSIGKSVEGRDIYMIIASTEKNITAANLKNSNKPLFLAQAGIHSGEIDGKDAGLMLLRDIAFGNNKELIQQVNFLFIPILSVDAHERSSAYNRPNQRGPQNMGWRTNAQNLNLNRDYAKLDTKEIRSVIEVINSYDPLLYMDIHVTDGADYQYDITYGGLGKHGYSTNIKNWLENTMKPYNDKDLANYGHIPGPLLNAFNERDFLAGNIVTNGNPRFSDDYGNVRHLATVLVENHSLKPYKQRVLGTYVLLQSTLNLLAKEGASLKKITEQDKAARPSKVPMAWKVPHQNGKPYTSDSLYLLGITSEVKKSTVTNEDYVVWLGKQTTIRIPDYKSSEAIDFITRPKGYWIPAACDDVIARLKMHGIRMTTIAQPTEVMVEMYRINTYSFGNESGEIKPFEGHMQVSGSTTVEIRKQLFSAGSVYISTDQPLGNLLMLLLEPLSKDSFFSWGFFHAIFQRTEYIEAYVMEPMSKKMMEDSPELRKEFEQKNEKDKAFAKDSNAILSWFYSKTKFYDDRYLLYPVGRAL